MANITLQGLAVAIRNLARRVDAVMPISKSLAEITAWLHDQPPSITDEIDRIPGRRVEFVLANELEFTASDEGTVGRIIPFNVSQDGPFIMTHYPMAVWRPTEPTSATNFGRWRPVTSWPLPVMEIGDDIIDIGYELQDGGNNRDLQSAPRGPIFSRPDNLIPLPVPVQFATAAQIAFTPVWHRIGFTGSTPPTKGVLHVDLIGYKVVNL